MSIWFRGLWASGQAPDGNSARGTALVYSASRNAVSVTSSYLNFDGMISAINGPVLPFDSTLVAMSISGTANQTWVAQIMRNKDETVQASLNMTNATKATDDTLDVDFDKNDMINFYCNGTGINNPAIICYFAGR